jgi:hypothetical protein
MWNGRTDFTLRVSPWWWWCEKMTFCTNNVIQLLDFNLLQRQSLYWEAYSCSASIVSLCFLDPNNLLVLEVCKSVHYHTIQINQPTRCNNFSSFITWRLCTAQHVSGVLTSIIRSSTTAVAASAFTFGAWQQHCYHHAPTVKPETATAVVELLMMGAKHVEPYINVK